MSKSVVVPGEILWEIPASCTALGGAPLDFACRVNSPGDIGVMAPIQCTDKKQQIKNGISEGLP